MNQMNRVMITALLQVIDKKTDRVKWIEKNFASEANFHLWLDKNEVLEVRMESSSR
jgi:hypothetical protein